MTRNGPKKPVNSHRTKVAAQNPLKNLMIFEEHLISVSVLNRTNECRRLLNGFKIKDIYVS